MSDSLPVAAELEALHPMRPQPVLLPDAMDRGRRQPEPLWPAAAHPNGSPPWACAGCSNHCLLLGRSDAPRSTRTRPGPQAGKFFAPVAPPPHRHGVGRDSQQPHALAVGARQNHPGPQRQTLRQRRRTQPRFQPRPIRFRHLQAGRHIGQVSIPRLLLLFARHHTSPGDSQRTTRD